MAEVASAFVALVPTTKGWAGQVEGQVSGPLAAAGKSGGGRFSSAFGGVIKKGVAATGLAAGTVLGYALVKGFQRLSAIEDAKASLTGLGHSAKSVDLIMTNALASVKGTAFGLGDAATVAASAVAAGIKPGKQLEANLRLVADAATIAKVPIGEMGAVFNKVASSNKIQGDVINQLNQRGIPIVQLLGKTMGKTSAEVTQLASQGKIDFATFSKAMQEGLGGSALKSGDTFKGALANVGASLSRIGAGLLGGVFPHLAPGLQGITKALAPLEGKAEAVGNKIGLVLGPAIEKIGPFISKAITGLSSFDFSGLASGSSQIGQAFRDIGASLAGIDFSSLRTALGEGVSDTVSVFAVAIGFLADHLDLLAKALPAIVVGFVAYKTVQAASNVLGLAGLPIQTAHTAALFLSASANRSLAASMAVTNTAETVGQVTRSRSVISLVASNVAMVAAGIATKAYAAAQWLLNAALTANPIGLLVVAIAAVVAVLIYAFTHSEKFRAGVIAVFTAIKNFVVGAVTAVVNFVKTHWKTLLAILTGPIGLAVLFITRNWGKIKAATSAAFNFVKSTISGAISAVVNFISGGIGKAVGFFKGLLGKIKGALSGAKDALKGIGKDIVNGLISGISSLGGAVKDALLGLLPGPLQKFAGALGISSPSTVFRDFGLNIGEGLVIGIDRKRADVSSASGRLAASVAVPAAARFDASASSGAGTAAASPGSTSVADMRMQARLIAEALAGSTFRLDQRGNLQLLALGG